MASSVKNFLDGQGRLKQYPAKRKMQVLALAYLAEKLDAGKVYTEKEINEAICRWHTYGDHATLRRDLFDMGFLNRTSDGREYQLADPQPDVEKLLESFS